MPVPPRGRASLWIVLYLEPVVTTAWRMPVVLGVMTSDAEKTKWLLYRVRTMSLGRREGRTTVGEALGV